MAHQMNSSSQIAKCYPSYYCQGFFLLSTNFRNFWPTSTIENLQQEHQLA